MDKRVHESPCLGCTDRAVNCHSTCSLYKQFRQRLDQHNQHIRAQKYKANIMAGYYADLAERTRKKRK